MSIDKPTLDDLLKLPKAVLIERATAAQEAGDEAGVDLYIRAASRQTAEQSRRETMVRLTTSIATSEAALARLTELRDAEPDVHVRDLLTRALRSEQSALAGNRKWLADLADRDAG